MESSGNSKRGLLTLGGILSLAGGIYLIFIGVSWVIMQMLPFFDNMLPSGVADVWVFFITVSPMLPFFLRWQTYQLEIVGGCFGILGIIAIIGGISAIRRWRFGFGLSLAGAICALPSVFVGILAVILVVMGKREFKVKEIDAEVV